MHGKSYTQLFHCLLPSEQSIVSEISISSLWSFKVEEISRDIFQFCIPCLPMQPWNLLMLLLFFLSHSATVRMFPEEPVSSMSVQLPFRYISLWVYPLVTLIMSWFNNSAGSSFGDAPTSSGKFVQNLGFFTDQLWGKLISKQNCRAITSPKNWTNEFVFWEKLRLDNFVSRSTDL